MKKYHTILDCGHSVLLPKNWREVTCPVCGLIYVNLK